MGHGSLCINSPSSYTKCVTSQGAISSWSRAVQQIFCQAVKLLFRLWAGAPMPSRKARFPSPPAANRPPRRRRRLQPPPVHPEQRVDRPEEAVLAGGDERLRAAVGTAVVLGCLLDAVEYRQTGGRFWHIDGFSSAR
jgi:hypothetical protein